MKIRIFGYELSLQKKEIKRKVRSRVAWTGSETNAMLRMRNEKKSWKEIGDLLNRTPNSCYARYYKIKKDKK